MSNNESKVYVISDTHFGHKRIMEFEPVYRNYKTVEEHDKDLIQRWNAVVRSRDSVWHLGDVFFGKDGHLALAACNGNKKLVLGNHDHYPIAVYQRYFSKIVAGTGYKGALLTHIPVHESQLAFRWPMNIHGHMHSKRLEDKRYVCVSAEHTGLAPVLLSTVLEGKLLGVGLTTPPVSDTVSSEEDSN